MIKGKDLILCLGSTPMAASKSCKLRLGTDFIETCSPTEGDFKQFLPTIKSWDVSADLLMATMRNYHQLHLAWDNKSLVTLQFYDAALETFYRGNAYIKNMDITGSVNGLATFAITFQPTGALQYATQQVVNLRNQTEHRQRKIIWGASTFDIRENTQTEEANNDYIVAYELNIPADTRITAIHRAIVVKKDLQDVIAMLVNEDAQSIAAEASMINFSNSIQKDVIMTRPRGTYNVTIIANRTDCMDGYQILYLSKF